MDLIVGKKVIKEQSLSFVNQGGEKKVYRDGKIAYAIYHDPNKMIPVGKIQELSVLDRPEIIRPLDLIHDKRGKVIGHTMTFLEGAVWFSKFFGSKFCKTNRIDDKKKIEIVRKFRSLLEFIHQHDCYVVDVNELNFMLSPDATSPIFAIDTPTYKTPSYRATAIVPLIQDPHTNGFNANTDWYSWGMLICQLLIGTNPYRGNHPDFDNIPLSDRVEARKVQNVSIFNPKSVIPSACNPISVLPKGLYDWMLRVYEKGERIAPPVNFDELAKILVQIPKDIVVNGFSLIELGSFREDVIAIYPAPSRSAMILSNGDIRWGKDVMRSPTTDCKVLWNAITAEPYVIYIKEKKLFYMQKDGIEHDLKFNAYNIIESNGRVIVVGDDHICEVSLMTVGRNPKVFLDPVGVALKNPDATTAVDGIILENHLGSWVYQVYKEKSGCFYGSINEIKGKRVVDVVAQKNVFVLKTFDNGSYDRYIFRLDEKGYDFILDKDVPTGSVSLAVNDAGVGCCLTESSELIIFSARRNSTSIQRMSNTAIDSSFTITGSHDMIVAYKGNRVWRLAKASS